MITFNNIVSKFQEFCDNHFFIKTFSYGSPSDVDLEKFEQYPLLHLVYTGGDYNSPKAKTYNLEVYILSVPPSDADKVGYQKENISDAEQVAEDILADIQNGGNIFQFGFHYDLVNASVTPLEETQSNALAGCLLDIAISVPYTYDSCNAPLSGVEPEGTPATAYKARGLLRVKEIDGSPDVLSVATINVPNGSLTDDGDGTITLDFGAGAVSAVTATAPLSSTGGTTPDISLDTSGVTAGSYTAANITVDSFGRITDATSGAVADATRIVVKAKNVSGRTLAKGTPVHAVTPVSQGQQVEVIEARADTPSAMPATLVLNEILADKAEGEAIVVGLIQNVNTSAFSAGDIIYVGETGGYTNVKPTGDNLIQNLGVVVKSSKTAGSGIVYGSGRSNDVPNIPEGYGWLGNASGVATPTLFNFYLNRFDSTASTMASTLNAGTATIERIDTARWTGTGVYLNQQSDTPSAGNAIKRKVYYKDEFGSTDAFGTWTLIHEFADDTSYATALAYINDTIIAGQTNGTAPASLVMTWEDAAGFTGLLDDYPGAAAAYSLRLLDKTYTGSAIRVRRASDNAEQDIGFSNNELDTSALATFCSGTDGFVKTWYSQTGTNDLTQTSTGSQPKIYDSVSGVVTENGKPAMQMDSNTKKLSVPNSKATFKFLHDGGLSSTNYVVSPTDARETSGTTQKELFETGQYSSSIGLEILYQSSQYSGTEQARFLVKNGTAFPVDYTTPAQSFNVGQNLVTFYIDADNSTAANRLKVGLNGATLLTGNTSTAAPSTANSQLDFTIYGGFTAHWQEVIVWNSDESSNRSGIETNINDFYSIY